MQPKLRFKGFTDGWNRSQLKDCCNNIGDGLHGTPRYVKNGDVAFINGNNIKNGNINISSAKKVDDKQKSKDDLALDNNTLLMSINGTIGNLAYYEGQNIKLGKSTAYIKVQSSKLNKYFLLHLLKYEKVRFYFKNSVTGTTIHNLGLRALKATPIVIPSLPEQRLIGCFFAKLDKLISLQQAKCSLLKKQKLGYLQKLFPRKDESVPRVRFNGFSNKWTKCKLKDLGKIYTGNTPKKKDKDNYMNDGMPWVTPTDINGIYIKDTPLELSDKGIKKARIVPTHSILVTCIASIGKNVLTTSNSSFNQQINALIPNKDTNYYFLYIQSYFWSQYMIRIAPKGTMQIINKSTFSNIETRIPSLAEQQEIGRFFKRLDDNINLQKNKLNYLHKLKKAYLQKMFC